MVCRAGESRLAASLDVVCYEGSHLPTAVLIWIVILPAFCVGFPLWCLFAVLQHRRAKIGSQIDSQDFERFGFLV